MVELELGCEAIVWVFIWVVEVGEAVERVLDLGGGAGSREPQNLVVCFSIHSIMIIPFKNR